MPAMMDKLKIIKQQKWHLESLINNHKNIKKQIFSQMNRMFHQYNSSVYVSVKQLLFINQYKAPTKVILSLSLYGRERIITRLTSMFTFDVDTLYMSFAWTDIFKLQYRSLPTVHSTVVRSLFKLKFIIIEILKRKFKCKTNAVTYWSNYLFLYGIL